MIIETKQPQPQPAYDIHCNVCGTKFNNEGEHRTCGIVCELVLTNAHAKAKKPIEKLTADEKELYDEALARVEGRPYVKGVMDQMFGKKRRRTDQQQQVNDIKPTDKKP